MAATAADDLFIRYDRHVETPPGHLVEFAARGIDLELSWKGGRMVQRERGSSFAAPHVAGLLARLLPVYPA